MLPSTLVDVVIVIVVAAAAAAIHFRIVAFASAICILRAGPRIQREDTKISDVAAVRWFQCNRLCGAVGRLFSPTVLFLPAVRKASTINISQKFY